MNDKIIDGTTDDQHPEGWELISDSEHFRAGIVAQGNKDALKSVLVGAQDVGALVLGPAHAEGLDFGEGPIAGGWPAIMVKGVVLGPDGKPIDTKVLGFDGAMVVVPDSPTTVFQLIDACLTVILSEDQMSGITRMVQAMYDARRKASESGDPEEYQPTVLEKQFVLAQQQGQLGGALNIPESVEEALATIEDPDTRELARRLLEAITQDEAQAEDAGEEIN